MMDPFTGYDQWKTASPYDDEPDLLEETERALKEWGAVSGDVQSNPKITQNQWHAIALMVECLERWREEA